VQAAVGSFALVVISIQSFRKRRTRVRVSVVRGLVAAKIYGRTVSQKVRSKNPNNLWRCEALQIAYLVMPVRIRLTCAPGR
jgi:hypothetical protein